MKKNLFFGVLACALIALLVVTFASPPAQAAGETSPRLITVTGDADVKVAPDEVILVLGVENADRNLSVAKKQNDDRTARILTTLKNFGVESKHIQTDQFRVEPRYSDSYTRLDVSSYLVSKTIVVTLKDIAKFEDVQSAVLDAGASRFYSIQFRTTELRKYRDQARELAVRAAQEKATAMAKTLGQKIGKPQSIQENYSNWYSWYDRWWGGGGSMSQNVVQNVSGPSASSDDSAFAPGQITINARVTVSFELE
jgi:uncharacterized protein YggE